MYLHSHLGKKVKQSHKKSYKFKHVLLGQIVVYVSSGDYDLYLKLYVIWCRFHKRLLQLCDKMHYTYKLRQTKNATQCHSDFKIVTKVLAEKSIQIYRTRDDMSTRRVSKCWLLYKVHRITLHWLIFCHIASNIECLKKNNIILGHRGECSSFSGNALNATLMMPAVPWVWGGGGGVKVIIKRQSPLEISWPGPRWATCQPGS